MRFSQLPGGLSVPSRLLLSVILVGAVISCVSAQPPPQKETVATVNGERLTEADLGIQGQLHRLEQQAYQLRLRAVENAISRKLLEQAARERGLSVEDFVKQEADAKVPDPPPGEIEAFYLALREKFGQPLDQVRQQIASQLKALRTNEAREALGRRLRERANVVISLEAPRVQLELDGAPRRGPASARVTIVEFSDFQCPYCKRVQPTLKQILSKYGDQVSLVFKDLPLSIHSQAQPAAQAARCAMEQGRFWEYHDELFEAAQLGPDLYPKIAEKLGLDSAAFETCRKSGRYGGALQSAAQYAASVGANSTPSFFINGIPLAGAQPLEGFSSLIDAELARPKR